MEVKKHLLVIIMSFLITSCSDENNPLCQEKTINYNGFIKIETDKREYNIDPVSSSNFTDITGKLTNTTTDTLYSELGDRYNASIEQELLLFANGNDGSVEYYNKENNWVNIKQGTLMEGSKVIRLSPKSSYAFRAPVFITTGQTGQYRLIVKYYKSYNTIITDTLRDTSNAFTIY